MDCISLRYPLAPLVKRKNNFTDDNKTFHIIF